MMFPDEHSQTFAPTDFLQPAADNQWMWDVANGWIDETRGLSDNSDPGMNLFVWSETHPVAAFSVIQTILQIAEVDDRLFSNAAAARRAIRRLVPGAA